MNRVFKVKTRDYIKDAIDINNLNFPWKFNGFTHEPIDGKLQGFYDWRRIVNQEKLESMMQLYFQRINEGSALRLEKIVEHSLMAQIHRELSRYKQQQN